MITKKSEIASFFVMILRKELGYAREILAFSLQPVVGKLMSENSY
jgi:hypothetical protein